MPSNANIQATFEKAEKEEEKYQWAEAAKIYKQLLSSEKVSSYPMGRIWEKIALCYSQASRQTENQEQFRKLRRHAADAYRNAAKFFDEKDTVEAIGKRAQCYALAEYTISWLVSTPNERRRVLENCCLFGQKSLEAFEKTGDELNYGKMSNDLLLCLLDRLYVARDSKQMSTIAQEGIECADRAITVLSRIGNKNELLRFYCTASLECWWVSNYVEQEEKAQKDQAHRSLDYSEKALALSEEVNDPYLAAASDWAAAFCAIAFTENAESALEHARNMLKLGTTLRDNYLKGIASYILAFVTDMITLSEADPDKKKEGHQKVIKYSEEAISHLSSVSQDYFMAETYLYYAESYLALASCSDIGLEERRAMLEKAVKIGRKGLECATNSGSPEADISTLHALSKALQACSNVATGKHEKGKLLEEALEKRAKYIEVVERVFPSMDWIYGVGKNYEGLIKVELARIEIEDRVKKTNLLRSAVSDMEDSVLHCRKWIASHAMPSHIAATAGFEDSFGGILNELHSLTGDEEILARAIEINEDAARQFKKVDLPNRAAESYWRMAGNLDRLGDHQKAAQNFERALAEYRIASERIPHFAAFYEDYALYMEAWSEIEKARLAHKLEKYAEAMKHYENAANLVNTKLWGYLYTDFLAWSLLEKAEDLSRKECITESKEAFKQAAEFFEKAQKVLREETGKIQNQDERDKASELCEASIIREEYCLARADVEEARKYDLEGSHVESAEKYGSAASILEKVLERTEAGDYRKEIKPIACMCRAWQKMKMAETRVSPELYHEASRLFLEAKEYGERDKTTLLASGNGAFCKALEHGTRFEAAHEKDDFTKAKQYLGSAANYYIKAGFENAFIWASAAEILLDAYNYMMDAEIESSPETKMKAYLLAEKCLERSAKLYETAGYIGKRDEVLYTLRKVNEKREFVLSLRDLLAAPGDASSTHVFPAPISTVEEPVGLQKFEREFIHANLAVHQKETRVGEVLDLEIQLASLGKNAALLARVEGIVPEGFDLVEEPVGLHVENGSLNMRGKCLNPLETKEFRLTLRSFAKGTYTIKPRIVYLDETGNELFCELEPVTINVSEVVLPDRVATGHEDLDNMLFGGIPKEYAVILTSPSFDERTFLVRRFLETGAKRGELTFYVTIDPGSIKALAKEYQRNFYLFLCNPQADKIVESLQNVFKLKGVENLTEISIALTSAFRQVDVTSTASRRVCIEIISDVLLQHHAVSTRRWLAALIPEFRSRGFTTLAIVNPQIHSPQEVQAILDLFEGEINIFEKETKRGLEKFLKIKKMHDQMYVERELPLKREKLRT